MSDDKSLWVVLDRVEKIQMEKYDKSVLKDPPASLKSQDWAVAYIIC